MVLTAADFKEAGISVPLLVGGAALSERFTVNKIAPAYGEAVCYAKDAMTGLRLMNQMMDPAEREAVLAAHRNLTAGRVSRSRWWKQMPLPVSEERSAKVRVDIPDSCPRRIWIGNCATCRSWRRLWSYINPFMLYGRHLGYKGNFEKDLAQGNAKALELSESGG